MRHYFLLMPRCFIRRCRLFLPCLRRHCYARPEEWFRLRLPWRQRASARYNIMRVKICRYSPLICRCAMAIAPLNAARALCAQRKDIILHRLSPCCATPRESLKFFSARCRYAFIDDTPDCRLRYLRFFSFRLHIRYAAFLSILIRH